MLVNKTNVVTFVLLRYAQKGTFAGGKNLIFLEEKKKKIDLND